MRQARVKWTPRTHGVEGKESPREELQRTRRLALAAELTGQTLKETETSREDQIVPDGSIDGCLTNTPRSRLPWLAPAGANDEGGALNR